METVFTILILFCIAVLSHDMEITLDEAKEETEDDD